MAYPIWAADRTRTEMFARIAGMAGMSLHTHAVSITLLAGDRARLHLIESTTDRC
jgi:hypothetical protein